MNFIWKNIINEGKTREKRYPANFQVRMNKCSLNIKWKTAWKGVWVLREWAACSQQEHGTSTLAPACLWASWVPAPSTLFLLLLCNFGAMDFILSGLLTPSEWGGLILPLSHQSYPWPKTSQQQSKAILKYEFQRSTESLLSGQWQSRIDPNNTLHSREST